MGINAGPALYRTGDYLGGAVNVASRVVNSAMPGQILLTEPVAKAASNDGIPVEELGVGYQGIGREVDAERQHWETLPRPALAVFAVRDSFAQSEPWITADTSWRSGST